MRIFSVWLRLAILFVLLLGGGGPAAAAGEVTTPNGEYQETRVDLKVAALGGAISVERSWLNGRWYFNPAWADLRFTYDALNDGSVKTIDRAGTVYEAGGGLYVNDDRFFIRKTDSGWRWNDTFGNWVDYDAAGKIQRYGDRNDVTVRFVRNGDGRIAQVKDHNEVTALTFHYTGGKVTRIVDRANRDVEYHWTGDDLTTVTDVLGHEWTYTYDGNGQVKGGEDPEGREWSLTYLQSYRAVGAAVPVGVSFSGISGRDFRISRVATLKNEAGHTMRYEYDYDRSKRLWSYIVKYPSGRTEATVFDLEGRVMREEEGNAVTYQRTRDGDRIDYSKDERGMVTRRDRDRHRNVTLVTYPDATTESWTYHPRFSFPTEHVDARGTRTTYRYDDRGNRIEMIEAVGEPEARTTTYAWNALGQVTSITVKGATTADDATTSYTYDDFGNVATITDAEEVTTSYTHHVTGEIEILTDGREHAWRHVYNDAGWLTGYKPPVTPAVSLAYDKVGNRSSQTDAAGYVTSYEYDGLDRLIKTIDARQGVSRNVFNTDGELIERVDESGMSVKSEFDARGRLWKEIDGAGNVTELVYGTHAQALEGLIVAVRFPTYREEYRYDARGRRTRTTRVLDDDHQEAESRELDANGAPIAVTDALGRVTLYQYDRLGRRIAIIDALAGDTRHAYDSRNNLIAFTDANDNTHRFRYDRRGRLLEETRPLGAIIRFRYDANGNRIEKIDAANRVAKFHYDAENQRTRAEYFLASAGTPYRVVVFDFDDRGLLTGYDDQQTRATYLYDALGRRVSTTVDYGPFVLGHGYDYQANGLKGAYTGPDGAIVSYTYAGDAALRTVTIPGEGTIAFTDMRWGRPATVTYPGGTVRSTAFDALMRVRSSSVRNAAGTVLAQVDNDFDAAGRLRVRSTGHGVYRYGYDALNRLVDADYPNGAGNDHIDDSFAPDTFPFADDTFAYDAVGNRIADAAGTGDAPWRYNADNELVDSASARYVYDENGAVREQRSAAGTLERSYVHDTEQRLREIRDGSGQLVASYYYDPFGFRLWKTVAANQPGNDSSLPKTTYYHYNDEGYAAEYVHAGAHPDAGAAITPVLDRLYLFPPQGIWSSGLLATRIVRGENAGWRYPEFDDIGMASGWIGDTGSSTGKRRTGAFGAVVEQGDEIALRFAGQIADPEASSHYNLNRDYAPGRGRYLQRDPLGLSAGANVYAYADLDPVGNTDPLGLLTAYKNCDKQKPAIENAEKNIEKLLKDCQKDCDGKKTGCVPCKWVKKIREKLASNSVQCIDGDGCGKRNPAGGFLGFGAKITLYPDTFDPNKCGCLEATIFHEVLHGVAGRHKKPFNKTPPSCKDPTSGGDTVYSIERKCFPCAC